MVLKDTPDIHRGIDPENDFINMHENNYGFMGFSSFNGANVDIGGAASHAKKIHATNVIVYSKYTNTLSGMIPFITPDTRTTNTTFQGNVVYGSAGYSGDIQTTTYGSTTTYIPYSIHSSDHLDTYWAKYETTLCGLHLTDLTPELRQELGSNKGMLIFAVAKDSPAFHSDIFRDDILRKIGTTDICNKKIFVNHCCLVKLQTKPNR